MDVQRTPQLGNAGMLLQPLYRCGRQVHPASPGTPYGAGHRTDRVDVAAASGDKLLGFLE
jgi:hypothetical protein